ncbi:MAG: hypothetical protein GY869_08670 [Planctomycetes bacterium]|nr:hypothetical protein [Planctomycetota bacterium]
MRELVYTIADKLTVEWSEDVKAMVDTWTSYFVTLEQFKEAVLIQGVNFAKARGVQAWVVDSSQAKGVFRQEIQDFIGSDIFPKFGEIGVKYFITINSELSTTTKMTVTMRFTALPSRVRSCGGRMPIPPRLP